MKFTLVVAVIAVLALAHGSLAQEVPDFERLSQMFEEMKTKVSEQVNDILRNHNLEEHAQTAQEQLKAVVTNLETQLKPVADNVQSNVQPVLDNIQKQLETLFQTLTEQARAIAQ